MPGKMIKSGSIVFLHCCASIVFSGDSRFTLDKVGIEIRDKAKVGIILVSDDYDCDGEDDCDDVDDYEEEDTKG